MLMLIAPPNIKGFAALSRRFDAGLPFKTDGGLLIAKFQIPPGTPVRLIATTAIEEHKLKASPYGSGNVKVTESRRTIDTVA